MARMALLSAEFVVFLKDLLKIYLHLNQDTVDYFVGTGQAQNFYSATNGIGQYYYRIPDIGQNTIGFKAKNTMIFVSKPNITQTNRDLKKTVTKQETNKKNLLFTPLQ